MSIINNLSAKNSATATASFIRQVILFFLRTHLLLAIGATLLTYETILISSSKCDVYIIFLVVFFSALFVYNVTHIKILFYNPSSQGKEIKVNIHAASVLHVLVIVISSISIILLFFYLEKHEQSLLIITAVATLAYIMPFAFNNRHLKGIRNIPVMKNLWLALVWALVTVLLPLVSNFNNLPVSETTILFLRRFLFIFALTIPFDIRDQQTDTQHKLNTLPTLIGIERSKFISILSIAIFILLVFIDQQFFKTRYLTPLHYSTPLYISAAITILLILCSNPSRKIYFYSFLMDGALIMQFLLVYLFVK